MLSGAIGDCAATVIRARKLHTNKLTPHDCGHTAGASIIANRSRRSPNTAIVSYTPRCLKMLLAIRYSGLYTYIHIDIGWTQGIQNLDIDIDIELDKDIVVGEHMDEHIDMDL